MFRPSRGRQPSMGVILLFLEVARIGFEHIPPVTLVTLGINVVNYLLNPLDMDLGEVCVQYTTIVYGHEVMRLFLSALFHVHDFHLYYNMSSLILKGRTLEPLVGSWRFACMIVVFALGSSSLMVAASYVLATFFAQTEQLYTCAVGFSTVLFALKVVVNELDPNGHRMILGIPVEMQYLAWAELLLIHVWYLNPLSSATSVVFLLAQPVSQIIIGRGSGYAEPQMIHFPIWCSLLGAHVGDALSWMYTTIRLQAFHGLPLKF
jgi:rhomboid domain-containing protein 1